MGLAETRVLLLVVVRMSYLRSVGPHVVHCHLMPVFLQRDLILMDSRLLTVNLLLVLVMVHPVGMLELLRCHDVLAIARAHLSASLLDPLVTLIDHLLAQQVGLVLCLRRLQNVITASEKWLLNFCSNSMILHN